MSNEKMHSCMRGERVCPCLPTNTHTYLLSLRFISKGVIFSSPFAFSFLTAGISPLSSSTVPNMYTWLKIHHKTKPITYTFHDQIMKVVHFSMSGVHMPRKCNFQIEWNSGSLKAVAFLLEEHQVSFTNNWMDYMDKSTSHKKFRLNS